MTRTTGRRELERKWRLLQEILSGMRSILIAYSGGVDSTLLLKAACDALDGKVLAVTAKSPTYTGRELKDARTIAGSLGARHRVIRSNELKDPGFRANTPDRCYYCKRELFGLLARIAREQKLDFVADGSNADDLSDHRPGRMAAREFGVRSPLEEAGLTKEDIRALSRRLGLPTWDKPPLACLASRFPYGSRITPGKLHRVEMAEEFIRRLGLKQVRVRDHGVLARIEVEPGEIEALLKPRVRKTILERLEELGYSYVTADLKGYRTGSMNEVLGAKRRRPRTARRS